MIKLRKCPFCGEKAHFGTVKYSPCELTELNKRTNGYFVKCEQCSAQMGQNLAYATEKEAGIAWNKRIVFCAA